MANKKKTTLSGETKKITLFYDGDKYKDPVFVGINGATWQVMRGVEVEVPIEVYWILKSSEEQDKKTSMMIAELSKAAKELEEA